MSFHCGYIALVGRPNVGKSTLINQLVGESLAIVTPKPQTTRQRIVGIVQRPAAQCIIVDTPGFHESPKLFNRMMLTHVTTALADANVVCCILEPRTPLDPVDRYLWAMVRQQGRALRHGSGQAHLIAVINKMDRCPAHKVQSLLAAMQRELAVEPMTCSALYGTGVNALLATCIEHLPEGPPLYPTDTYTEHPMRFLAAELIREQATLLLGEELPYAIAVEVESFEEKESLTRIVAAIVVEKESQKGIVIGQGGRMIKRIGQQARARIEPMVGTKVYLELVVRVEEGWTRRPELLRQFGYPT